jgi:hypothetical protein
MLASRHGRFTPVKIAPGTHWIGGWVTPEPVSILWGREKSCPARNRNWLAQPVARRYTD